MNHAPEVLAAGTLFAVGTRVVVSAPDREPNLTVRLAEGTLALAGAIRHTDRHAALAITGGTGRYAGASGQLVMQR
jgi:hypothetical protein